LVAQRRGGKGDGTDLVQSRLRWKRGGQPGKVRVAFWAIRWQLLLGGGNEVKSNQEGKTGVKKKCRNET